MSIDVSDIRSNPNDQIAHAARVIGKSDHCRRVFLAIYQGKQKIKTATEIENISALPRMRVLQEAGKLSDNDIVKKTKVGGEIAYEKYPFYTRHKEKVLKLAGNEKALAKFPTKINPKIEVAYISVPLPKSMINIESITIDDIDSFSKVRGLEIEGTPSPIDEKKFKEGLQKILGEEGSFQDWGGEPDDLYSTRLIIKGERKSVAFGLKGKGTTGILTPKKMGKRGDQIQRLLGSPAEVFLVQYWGQIDESIIGQMKSLAIAKSVSEGRTIRYGIIDGKDTLRIITAYPECFS
jgi:hypothetical protein